MIDISQDTLLCLLVRAFLCGVILGLVYEVIRAFKMLCGVRYNDISPKKSSKAREILLFALTFVCDILFWLIAGLVSIILMYHTARGFFRGMTYLGLASGFLVYYLGPGRLMLKLNERIVKIVKSAVKKLLGLIYIPVRKIFCLAISLYHLTIGRIIGKIKEERKRRREARIAAAEAADTVTPEDNEGRESSLYALGKAVYKKQGRVSFGIREDDRA